MPRTVNEGFEDFLPKLTPTDTESEAAKNHRKSIHECLKRNFNILRFFRIGSFGNGTSIANYSDVDYLASFPTDQLKDNSTISLRIVRNALAKRFPDTGVRISCPTIVVPFGTNAKEITEIVVGDFQSKTRAGRHIYDIADCKDGWMKSSPEAHKSYVSSINNTLNNKAKPLIRFIKAWKFFNNVPISSFYLELRIAKYLKNEQSIIYKMDVDRILRWLYNNNLPAVQDPLGISGTIYPCKSDAKFREAKSKLLTAHVRAEKARETEEKGYVKDAFYWWNLLFNGYFPNYYY